MTTSHRLTAGTLLAGRYRLVEPLAGVGRSWRARDENDRRDLVARVVALPAAMPAADRDRAMDRTLRDAAALARVRHPRVAEVVDTVVEDGTPWVISVRPPGRSLGDVVRAEGPLPADAAARIGLQVLDALLAAGVPHGDLTPQDVVLGDDGRVTVIGFATTPVDGTETPGFRAPEGGPSRPADLWALGVTLYAAVEGRLPDGPGGGVLRPVLDRLLAIEPAQRSDTGAVRRLLAAVGGAPAGNGGTGAGGSPAGSGEPLSAEQPEISDPDMVAALQALAAALPTVPDADEATSQAPPPVPAPPSPPLTPPTEPAPPAGSQATTARPAARGTTAPANQPAAPGPKAPATSPALAAPPAPAAPAASSASSAPASATPGRRAPADSAASRTPAGAAPAPATPANPPATADRTAQTGPPALPRRTVPADSARAAGRATGDDPAAAPRRAARADAAALPRRTAPADSARAAGRAAPDDSAAPRRAAPADSAALPRGIAPDDSARASGRTAPGAPAPADRAVTPGSAPSTKEEPDATRTGATAAGRDRGGRRSRWPWAAVAAVVVLLALLLPLLLGRGGGDVPTPPAAEPTPSPTPTLVTPAPPPAGYRLYRDPGGWSIAVPAAWAATRTRTSTGTAVTFRDGDRALTVTQRESPPDDPYADQLEREPIRRAAIAGYNLMRLVRVSFRDWLTSDWEYRAGSLHALIRSTVTDAGRCYDIAWTTQDRRWTADRAYFDNAVSTFDPGA